LIIGSRRADPGQNHIANKVEFIGFAAVFG
jgi:hypothetical protein